MRSTGPRVAVNKSLAAGLAGAICGLALLGWPAAAHPQAYPDHAVKIIVSTTPGSAVDVVARLFGPYLAEAWKQPVVIENRGGANGQIAVGQVARAEPDGYTLLVTTAATLSTNPFLYPEAGRLAITGLDPVTKLVGSDFAVSVRPGLGVRTFGELVEYIKRNPGKLNMATSVRGGALNLTAELLKQISDLDFVIVPHNGGGLAVTSVLGGHTDALVETTTLTAPLVESNQLVPLATTGPRRSRLFKNVPTVAESGFAGCEVTGWIALVAPKGTPNEVVARIRGALAAIVDRHEVKERLEMLKSEPIINTPEEFRREWDRELDTWKGVIERAGIKLEP